MSPHTRSQLLDPIRLLIVISPSQAPRLGKWYSRCHRGRLEISLEPVPDLPPWALGTKDLRLSLPGDLPTTALTPNFLPAQSASRKPRPR